MEWFEYLKKVNASGAIDRALIDKNKAIAMDDSAVLLVISQSKKPVFNDSFAIIDLSKFLKISDKFDKYTETKDRIVLKNPIQQVEWMKASKDVIEERPEPNLDYSDAIAIELDENEIIAIRDALASKFGDTATFTTINGYLYLKVGKQHEHNYLVKLAKVNKDVKATFSVTYLNYLFKTLSQKAKLYIKSNYPIKVVEETALSKTEYYLAPLTEEEAEENNSETPLSTSTNTTEEVETQ